MTSSKNFEILLVPSAFFIYHFPKCHLAPEHILFWNLWELVSEVETTSNTHSKAWSSVQWRLASMSSTGLFGFDRSREGMDGSMLPCRLFWDIDPSTTGCIEIHFLCFWGPAKWYDHCEVLPAITKRVWVCVYKKHAFVHMFCEWVFLFVLLYFLLFV